MTYMASVTLEQKKLEQLKKQLFGKSDSTPYKITPQQLKEANNLKQGAVNAVALQNINLKTDLLKITILSAIALGIQFSLFFAQQNGLLKLF